MPIGGLAKADDPSTLLATVDAQPGMRVYAWHIFPEPTTAQKLAEGYCSRLCLTREPKAPLDAKDNGAT